MTYDEVTAAFLELSSLSDECLKKIERFIVLLYGRTSSKSVVNEARKQLFAQKGRIMDAIPPSQAALVQHTKRAAYQGGHCWGQAVAPSMTLPCPSEWGWEPTSDGWKPVWSTLPDVSRSCYSLIKCGCKMGCRSSCSLCESSLKMHGPLFL